VPSSRPTALDFHRYILIALLCQTLTGEDKAWPT
jgi:hypothetical protein